uniref:Uncharacterized protein n=1 Tax=Scleropages formosus TaxID=113540 RepID=A0A8D0CMH1_SCLFO
VALLRGALKRSKFKGKKKAGGGGAIYSNISDRNLRFNLLLRWIIMVCRGFGAQVLLVNIYSGRRKKSKSNLPSGFREFSVYNILLLKISNKCEDWC